jgi:diguanylate cyclase (GGDEF)-like protein
VDIHHDIESLDATTMLAAPCQSGSKVIRRFALTLAVGFLVGGAALSQSEPQPIASIADRIETLNWADPARALRAIQTTPSTNGVAQIDIPMLEVQGSVYADMYQQTKVDEVIARLQSLISRGNQAAVVAAHFVRAYSQFRRGQYTAASVELGKSNVEEIKLPTERYRYLLLLGDSLRIQHQTEAALPRLEQASALAQSLRDDTRAVRAMLLLARLNAMSGKFGLAATQIEMARTWAIQLADEGALADVESGACVLAGRLGDRVAERRACLAELEHAKRSGSSRWLAHALIDLSDSYLETHEFRESLKYSRQALSITATAPHSEDNEVALFNAGLAYIGLGKPKAGRQRAELAIDDTLANDDLSSGEELLRDYADALERAQYLVMAIDVYRRHDELVEKVTSTTRRLAYELSGQVNDERRARELELLRHDVALKAAEMREQRLRQQLALAAALFIACICAALIWAFIRVRIANDRLRTSSERDVLTGLRNRRYFNEQVLHMDGARPAMGCVLLVDIDHFKQINDTFGHAVGDVVLTAVSHRLSSTLRASDKLVRWGGEEFLAVLDSMPPEYADVTIARLLAAVRQDPITYDGQAIHCTISIGYACFPMPGVIPQIGLESAIRLVDKALYEAKRRGRDRACRVSQVRVGDPPDLNVIGGGPGVSEAELPTHYIEIVAAA